LATWRYVTSHVTIHIGQTECWPETSLVYWHKPPMQPMGSLSVEILPGEWMMYTHNMWLWTLPSFPGPINLLGRQRQQDILKLYPRAVLHFRHSGRFKLVHAHAGCSDLAGDFPGR
jgi:hypothetical protein